MGIHEIVTASGADIFAASTFEHLVSICRYGTRKCVCKLNTKMSTAPGRLLIIPKHDLLITGAYNVHGVCAYSISSGDLIWQRKDFKRVMSLKYDATSESIACFCSQRAGAVLNPKTGETIEKYRGVEEAYYSNIGHKFFIKYDSFEIHSKTGLIKKHAYLTTFHAFLHVCFDETTMAASTPGSCVQIFNLSDGNEIGRYEPPEGSHVLELGFSKDEDVYLGTLWEYRKGSFVFLLKLDKSGKLIQKIPCPDAVTSTYVPSRKTVICSTGKEYSWDTGELVFEYEFPDK